MSEVRNVLVVGGGVGGMCAAICLSKVGLKATLVDADAHWRALGAGVTLGGGALRALAQVGVLDRVKELGAYGGSAAMLAADGTVIFAAPAGSRFGDGIPGVAGIMRPVLHKILQDATLAAGVEVKLGLALTRLHQDPDKVTAEFSDGSAEAYDLLLGADGVNSTVRQILFPDAEKPKFTGQGCWRAVVPRPPEMDGTRMFFGRQKCGVNPVSKTEMYLFLLQNLQTRERVPEAEWPTRLKAELAEFTDPLIADIREGLGPLSQVNYRPLEAGMLPQPWYVGRVLLVGDSAHATTPHSAYGAGLAIEDAVVLADVLSQGSPLAQALDQFMQRRYERCKVVVEGSIRQGELEQRGAPVDEMMRTMIAVGATIVEPI